MSPAAGPTIKDVARAAGVSIGTVSNVLNHPDKVRRHLVEQVEAAVEGLGYVRHAGAASMRSNRARAITIGLLVLDVTNPYFTAVARGAEDGANADGRLVIVCNSDDDPEKELGYLQILEEQRVLGLLTYPASQNLSALDALRERGMPIVLMERRRRGYCSVEVDGVAGGSLAARHLIDLGHTAVACLTPSLEVPQYHDRLSGFRDEWARAGLPAESLQLIELPTKLASTHTGRDAVDHLLSGPSRSTAVFCTNDLVAVGLIAELTDRGVEVPGDFSVIGYDDIDLATQGIVQLSTVRQPARVVGRTAAELLLRETQSPVGHVHQQIVFAPELVVRSSTAAIS